jgi:hypothetical protein
MQGLEHIIFDNTGTTKAASIFNLNIEAISKHIANRLKFDGPLIALAMRELKAPTINFPNNPTDPINLVKTTKRQRNFNHAHNQQKWWDENTQKIYNLKMQHSTPKMKTKLLTMDSWAKTSAAQDGIALLKTIRGICHKKDSSANATTAGMAHILIGSKEFEGIEFLQNGSSNPRAVATRKTLDPQRLYLDSTSSFHQVFTEEHLDNLRLAGATLRANCNASTHFATKKGWYRDLFDLWLVRNGIANLLSLPQLEADGFVVNYHTGGNWILTTPHGKEITFHQEEDGVCRGFPYINMQSTAAVAMIQTICQHYQGFTKCEVQDAIAARKAQAMTGHPTDA